MLSTLGSAPRMPPTQHRYAPYAKDLEMTLPRSDMQDSILSATTGYELAVEIMPPTCLPDIMQQPELFNSLQSAHGLGFSYGDRLAYSSINEQKMQGLRIAGGRGASCWDKTEGRKC